MGQRDAQRARLYAAENGVRHPALMQCVRDPVERCRAILNRHRRRHVRRGDRLASGWADAFDVRVNRRLRRYEGMAWARRIEFATETPRLWLVLHECAHVLTHAQRDHHGRDFCRVYLALVKAEAGVEAWSALRAAFRAHGVKYRRAPRTATPR